MASLDDRFLQMFFEEARELLITLEEGLMELERRRGDRTHLDKVFRAAHSIKGAAAMVGLSQIAEFTHGIEAVLDKVRNGSLMVDSDLISTLLEARDHLASAVESEAVGVTLGVPTDLVSRLVTFLKESTSGAATVVVTPAPPATRVAPQVPSPPPAPTPTAPVFAQPANSPPAPVSGKAKQKAESSSSKPKTPRAPRKKRAESQPGSSQSTSLPAASIRLEPGQHLYRIKITPGHDLLRRGVNPLGVLDELKDLGVVRVFPEIDAVPPLEELDPERCFLTWSVELQTEVPVERLEDVFLFIAEDSRIAIEELSAEGTTLPPPPSVAVKTAAVSPAQAAGLSSIPSPHIAPPVIRFEQPALPPRLVGESSRVVGVPKTGADGNLTPAEDVPKPDAAAMRPTVPPPPATQHKPPPRIRVDAGQLDDLVGLAGELAVLSDNLQTLRELPGAEVWIVALEALERVSRQIRDTTLELRMVPVEELFSRFPRVVRDLADRFGKEIELRIVGQETRLDRTIVERLSEPMIHLIRNCVDHGLEKPAEREAIGKPRMGRITLTAGHEGDRVSLRIEDDGRGLHRDRILAKAMARGLLPVGTNLEDPRLDTVIFEPGFSTSEVVNDVSGRGVGLDVVRDAVRGLRGSLSVESRSGHGTSFIFRLPLTLALIDGLLVETAGDRYVIPLAQVEECVALNGTLPALARERPCVSVRGELVPMVQLRRLFHAVGNPPPRQELLLTRHAGQRVGIAVDRLIGRVQAVIQALGEGLSGIRRFSGATILGDGTVSLILDLAALVAESQAADTQLASTFHRPSASS